MSHEISNRQALRDIIAVCPIWETWTGLADLQARKDRIAWPAYVGYGSPCIVVDLLAGGRSNIGGSHSSANFRSSGGMRVSVCDVIADVSDLQTSEDAFGEKFFTLIDQLVEIATDEGPLMIESIDYGEDWLQQSYKNVANAQDLNGDKIDDSATIERAFFVGIFFVRTGLGAR